MGMDEGGGRGGGWSGLKDQQNKAEPIGYICQDFLCLVTGYKNFFDPKPRDDHACHPGKKNFHDLNEIMKKLMSTFVFENLTNRQKGRKGSFYGEVK